MLERSEDANEKHRTTGRNVWLATGSRNLFLGTFKLTVPAIKSTLFGIPYNFKTAPKAIKGYFKYKAGDNFVVNSKTGTKLTKDTWDAYAILFEKSRIKTTT
jgi:hypothetical protein